MIANIDESYFRVLCKGDQRSKAADGEEIESQEPVLMLNIL